MKFEIITLFPEIFKFYLSHSLFKKAIKKKILKVNLYNLRNFSKNSHRKVDDRPYGGGRGMVLMIEPIYEVLKKIKREKKSKVIIFTPRGKIFDQKLAYRLSKLDQLILICGRYEGIDERVMKYLSDYKISIGNYILLGGELPALILIESISRLIPGFVGKSELLFKERIGKNGTHFEWPVYTRPEVFVPKKGVFWKVPKVLLSGDHQKIKKWRERHRKIIP